jgi:hypothetical protein
MRPNLGLLSLKGGIIIFLFGCQGYGQARSGINPYSAVGAIPVPAGYRRLPADKEAFGTWLRAIPLKKDPTVYLYDGSRKLNQRAQFAVLDVSVGHKDLQQCADAVMRLRAEFLYGQGAFDAIEFYTEQGVRLNFAAWVEGKRFRLSGSQLIAYQGSRAHRSDRAVFIDYLETVFAYCGTRTLERQLIPVIPFTGMRPGDVLIRGGAPGHAMIILDMAEDRSGHRVYLLAQSYMPAQDIHIVVNPSDPGLSPWYRLDGSQLKIETPEWTFYSGQLRTWPKMGR